MSMLSSGGGGSGGGTGGVYILSATVDGAGHLIVTLSTGTELDAGEVKGLPGETPSFSINSVTTLSAGSNATVTIDAESTEENILLNFGIPAGASDVNSDLTGFNASATAAEISATDTILSALEKLYAWTQKLWTLTWTEKFILNNPADAYVSPSLPLSRNGTMTTMDFYCTGTPASSTNIVVKQGGTTVGTAAISAAGKTTLTFSTAVTGTLDDLFTYTVSGAGLAACAVLANQKWGNR